MSKKIRFPSMSKDTNEPGFTSEIDIIGASNELSIFIEEKLLSISIISPSEVPLSKYSSETTMLFGK
jgi:hypothetical protein